MASFSVDELKRALDNDQLLPWYQPKVGFASGQWVGMEALARWQHPEYRLISPVCLSRWRKTTASSIN